jgi:hypothetical protein
VTFTEQIPDDSVQVLGEIAMLPFPEDVKATVPVCVGDAPVTSAQQTTGVPMSKDVCVQYRVVVDAFLITLGALIVSVVVRELP